MWGWSCHTDKLRKEVCEPSEEFDFSAKTLQAHMKTHSKLILKSLIYHTANWWDDLTLWPCCESSESLHLTPWACCDLFARSTNELTMQLQQWARCDLTVNLTVGHSGESSECGVSLHHHWEGIATVYCLCFTFALSCCFWTMLHHS